MKNFTLDEAVAELEAIKLKASTIAVVAPPFMGDKEHFEVYLVSGKMAEVLLDSFRRAYDAQEKSNG